MARARLGREFRGHHTHLACSFLGTELCNSLGSGERLARLDAVGLCVSRTPLTARSITPTESTRQSTPTGELLAHLSRCQRPTAGVVKATVNRREEESRGFPGERP